MNAEEMYQEVILEHYRSPRNFGVLDSPTMRVRDSNPACGDVVEVMINLGKDKKIEEIKFCGKGCAISQAAASMLTEFLKGKDIKVVKEETKEDVLGMLGIELSRIRLKCALLSLKVVKVAAYAYLGQEAEHDYA